MLETKGFFKMSVEDNFETGEVGKCQDSYVDHNLTAIDSNEMIGKIKNVIGCTYGEMDINACEEMGRVDCSIMETVEGYQPTTKQLSQWRNGEMVLYYCTYTFQIEEVTRKPFNLMTGD